MLESVAGKPLEDDPYLFFVKRKRMRQIGWAGLRAILLILWTNYMANTEWKVWLWLKNQTIGWICSRSRIVPLRFLSESNYLLRILIKCSKSSKCNLLIQAQDWIDGALFHNIPFLLSAELHNASYPVQCSKRRSLFCQAAGPVMVMVMVIFQFSAAPVGYILLQRYIFYLSMPMLGWTRPSFGAFFEQFPFSASVLFINRMYSGKTQAKLNEEKLRRKREAGKAEIEKNSMMIKDIYDTFQGSLNEFAKRYKDEIKSDPKFRDKFSDMCTEFDVNPMLSEKTLWAELGFGDFYHQLAMAVLDICAKTRHQNGGIMRVADILTAYHKRQKNQISSNDVIRALEKTYVLGNASVIDKSYVCTVPIELNNSLSTLLDLATKYGFVSARLLAREKKWSREDFEHNIRELRTKGIVWIDKQVPLNPHYYFLSHLGTDFSQFSQFVKQF